MEGQKKICFFLISQCITLFGSTLVQMAVIWYVTLQTDSGIWVAAFSVCSYLPQFVISFVGGVWADRYSRKRLILAADKVIVDHIGQTMERGCLKTVVEEGRFGPEKVYATVSQLALGQKPLGDLSRQILLCVMIGTGMLDIAVGQEYLKRAEEKGVGALFDFLEEE